MTQADYPSIEDFLALPAEDIPLVFNTAGGAHTTENGKLTITFPDVLFTAREDLNDLDEEMRVRLFKHHKAIMTGAINLELWLVKPS